jgi:1,4-alpha-glucan branching enzyme
MWARDLTPEGFRWIDANDAAGNTFTFIRQGPGGPEDVLVAAINFSGGPHFGYQLGLPLAGRWDEVLNTDAQSYYGSGVGNLGSITAATGEHCGQPAHADIVVPPLATVWFRKA